MPFFETENLSVEIQPNGTALLWLDMPGRSHNVFSRQVIADFEKALAQIAAEPKITLVVFLGRKQTGFVAGADLNEFKTIQGPEDAVALSAVGQQLMDRVANLRVPTVAVIHGPCLGGGLEFALACDYRIVLDQPGTQLGLPEIELGLVPGWGGTQRLPRVVGLERALQVILQRHRLNACEALQWRLADVAKKTQSEALEHITEQLAGRAAKCPKLGMPLRTWRQQLLESTALGRWLILRTAQKILRAKVPDDMPAPAEALEAVRAGLTQGFEAGLARERAAIGKLATTTACRNLVTLFFLIMNARKSDAETGSEPAAGDAATACRRVGIVGAGTMGAGIAQLAAVKGCEVVVQEINESALAAGIRKIEELFDKAVERRLLSRDEASKKLAAIGRTTSWQGFEDVDVVVEAALEDLVKKREIFRILDQKTRPTAILATNTSSLSVKQLQEGLQHPGRVAGLHFFNPVHKMPLVEVVRAPATEERALSLLTQWAVDLGKTPVVVGDSPGFVVNRILLPYLNEAGILLAEGMPVDQIDRVMRRFGMPMGPLELLDQVGLDVAAHIARAVEPAFGERLKPHPALERMSAHGWLGQKSGKGFYVYHGKKKTVHAEALARLAAELGTSPAHGRRPVGHALDRMVCLMVNEAAACLDEGLGERADVIDLAMVLGTGWAPHRGGPLRYADDCGFANVLKTLEELAALYGPRFEPCAELRRRAQSGELFYRALAELQAA